MPVVFLKMSQLPTQITGNHTFSGRTEQHSQLSAQVGVSGDIRALHLPTDWDSVAQAAPGTALVPATAKSTCRVRLVMFFLLAAL